MDLIPIANFLLVNGWSFFLLSVWLMAVTGIGLEEAINSSKYRRKYELINKYNLDPNGDWKKVNYLFFFGAGVVMALIGILGTHDIVFTAVGAVYLVSGLYHWKGWGEDWKRMGRNRELDAKVAEVAAKEPPIILSSSEFWIGIAKSIGSILLIIFIFVFGLLFLARSDTQYYGPITFEECFNANGTVININSSQVCYYHNSTCMPRVPTTGRECYYSDIYFLEGEKEKLEQQCTNLTPTDMKNLTHYGCQDSIITTNCQESSEQCEDTYSCKGLWVRYHNVSSENNVLKKRIVCNTLCYTLSCMDN